jgi:phosphoribosylaminoimidazole-succinocarboxamide synthase
LIDEILTPDSSRFWPLDEYEAGRSQKSFDKQYTRDYLDTLDWDKTPPGPVLPDEVVEKTREKYLAILKMITGKSL